jgi:hypothetical protein
MAFGAWIWPVRRRLGSMEMKKKNKERGGHGKQRQNKNRTRHGKTHLDIAVAYNSRNALCSSVAASSTSTTCTRSAVESSSSGRSVLRARHANTYPLTVSPLIHSALSLFSTVRLFPFSFSFVWLVVPGEGNLDNPPYSPPQPAHQLHPRPAGTDPSAAAATRRGAATA